LNPRTHTQWFEAAGVGPHGPTHPPLSATIHSVSALPGGYCWPQAASPADRRRFATTSTRQRRVSNPRTHMLRAMARRDSYGPMPLALAGLAGLGPAAPTGA